MKNFFRYLLVSYIVVLAVNIAANYRAYADGADWMTSLLFSLAIATIGVVIGLIFFPLFGKFRWTERPNLKFATSILIFIAFGVLIMIICMKGVEIVFHAKPSADDYIMNTVFSVLISVVIGLIITGNRFLLSLKKSVEDNKRLQDEMELSKFETLKNQVNPHFLFNSLNTLTVMIPTQPDIAVQFVEQMAKVFRYSLQHSDDNTVDIAAELKVVRSFLFLNEQRFNGKLQADINIDDAVTQHKVITQSLLMLVENAVKHNELSNEHPLKIDIYSDGAYLIVRNTLQPKRLPEQSTQMGLENIKKRYALTTDKPVVISTADNCFTVQLPLL